jgi:hypothetical protein
MAIDKKVLCPLLNEPCIEDGSIVNGELVACKFWMDVVGKNPQTGEEINQGNCSINWIPMLLIENSKVNRETGAAVESFRNEMVEANKTNAQLIYAVTQSNKLIEVK